MPRSIPERRKLEYGEKESKKSKDKPEKKHLVQMDGNFNGILYRNSKYRETARNWMKATGFYDDEGQISKGIRHQETFKKLTDHKKRQAYINERIELYTFEYQNKDNVWDGVINFKRPCGRPYGNEAHHILSCEIFYHDDWTVELLTLVKECGYDINNEGNIIYLPTKHDSCFYHDLPNHTYGHNKYNERVQRYTTKVLNKAKKVQDAGCDDEKEDYMKKLFEMLIKIEDMLYKYVTEKGPGPIGGRGYKVRK